MELIQQLTESLRTKVQEVVRFKREVSLCVVEENLYPVLEYMRQEGGFAYLTDIGTIDHYSENERFEIFYNLYNFEANQRVRVQCRIKTEQPQVRSVSTLWPSATWYEREAYDMMGIRFQNHPDLRRMYLPEDFEYFPLRKEFPLIGIPGSIQVPEKESPKGYK